MSEWDCVFFSYCLISDGDSKLRELQSEGFVFRHIDGDDHSLYRALSICIGEDEVGHFQHRF